MEAFVAGSVLRHTHAYDFRQNSLIGKKVELKANIIKVHIVWLFVVLQASPVPPPHTLPAVGIELLNFTSILLVQKSMSIDANIKCRYHKKVGLLFTYFDIANINELVGKEFKT